jgi:endoglucanase
MKRNACFSAVTLLGGALLLTAGGCLRSAENAGAAAMRECGPDGQIDDLEDNNNQNNVAEGRGGYWYTYVDKEGSTVWPEAGEQGGTFTPSEGGYNSKYAANVKGKIVNGNVVFGAMGMNFADPKSLYDAGKYVGITFWAKRGASSTPKLRVKLPDVNTDPEGGACSACFNDFGVDLNLGEQWQRYVIPFRELKQEPQWGDRKPHLNASKVFAIQWQTQAKGNEYDFWVDNIAFICKG